MLSRPRASWAAACDQQAAGLARSSPANDCRNSRSGTRGRLACQPEPAGLTRSGPPASTAAPGPAWQQHATTRLLAGSPGAAEQQAQQDQVPAAARRATSLCTCTPCLCSGTRGRHGHRHALPDSAGWHMRGPRRSAAGALGRQVAPGAPAAPRVPPGDSGHVVVASGCAQGSQRAPRAPASAARAPALLKKKAWIHFSIYACNLAQGPEKISTSLYRSNFINPTSSSYSLQSATLQRSSNSRGLG